MTITCNCNIKIKKNLILIKFQWLILDFIQSNKSILDPFANSLKFTQFEKQHLSLLTYPKPGNSITPSPWADFVIPITMSSATALILRLEILVVIQGCVEKRTVL